MYPRLRKSLDTLDIVVERATQTSLVSVCDAQGCVQGTVQRGGIQLGGLCRTPLKEQIVCVMSLN